VQPQFFSEHKIAARMEHSCSGTSTVHRRSGFNKLTGKVMSFSDHALTLITLASLFILGPAIGHAVVSCFSWQNWSMPIQHLAVGICTMFAVSGMILAYGYLWERSPTYVD